MTSDSLNFDQIEKVQAVPALDIHVPSGLIIAAAIASRDYQNVHHDRDQAIALDPKIF